ncbi:MAG: hypothetical protein J3Q66DRAFT_403897 [Benniella sp.]|nr:MAG: hypothetical protein J3Q66DRAFT_403897 [Benniella sp.]
MRKRKLSDEISLGDHFRDHRFQVTTRHILDFRTLLETCMGDTDKIIQQESQLMPQSLTKDMDGRYKQDRTRGRQLRHQNLTGDMDGRCKQDHTTGRQLRHQDFTGDMHGQYKLDHTTGNTAWTSGLYWRHF